MPVPDLESYKVTGGEVSSATKFNNLVQAVEDELADIDVDQIPGMPLSLLYDITLSDDNTSQIVTPSLSQDFSHLRWVLRAQGTTAANDVGANCRFNGVSATQYHWQYVLGSAAIASAAAGSSVAQMYIGDMPAASTGSFYYAHFVGDIVGYKTALYKAMTTEAFNVSASGAYRFALGGFWLSNAAITTLSFFPTTGNFKAGSRLSVYGLI